MRHALLISMVLLVVASCTDTPGGIQLDNTGTVAGIAYIDRDGDGLLTNNDGSANGVAASLVLEATGDTIARATSRADGSFLMSRVAAGRYRLIAQRGTAGDTVDVLQVDSAQISLAANDTVRRLIRLGYPRTTVEAVRQLPSGRRVTMEGIALNPWPAFADSTVHIFDPTGALRAVRVLPTAVQPGDSISMVGTTGIANGRVVLADVFARVITPARGLPDPVALSTAVAATADAGRLADGQVSISNGLVRDTLSVGNYRRVGVDDGSGRLEIMLNRATAFPVESYSIGARVSVTGILVPATAGGWQLKPRTAADVSAVFPAVTIAQARALPSGSRVYVDGIALNGWTTYADSTLHIVDNTGAIRAVRVQASGVVAGDSVQILGTTGTTAGRLALFDATVRIVSSGRGVPALSLVTTAEAATAGAGARADNQVRIAGAVILDTLTVAGDRVLGVDDGSGRLEVVLDKDISFNQGPFVPGASFAGAGLLVPNPTSTAWRLKPRDRDEATITFSTTTVSAVRTLPLGQSVVLHGRALNSWFAFGDSTVHIRDATGSLRTVRVTGVVAAGDSIRLFGTVSEQSGQRVLTGVTATVLTAGVGLPAPDSISTLRARSADNGSRDAALVRVGGTVTSAEVLPTADEIYTIDDGSGALEVFYDRDNNSGPPPAPGMLLNAVGVLVPTGNGTWQVKPRNAQDVSAAYPSVTIAQARQLPVGKTVQVRGVALNGRSAFSDGSLHLRDATSSIRILNVPQATIFAGDSIRVTATVGVNNGQPVLSSPVIGTAVLLAGVGTGNPPVFTTAVAANAFGGALDAAQVQVTGTATAISQQGQDRLITISDGSGDLVVRLDSKVTGGSQPYEVGDLLRVRGVLVPTSTGTTWELKPRTLSDVVKTN